MEHGISTLDVLHIHCTAIPKYPNPPPNIIFIVAFYYDYLDSSWHVFDEIINALFWLDLIFQSLSAYYDSESKLIRTRKEVFSNYAKTWFIFDLLACLPLEVIVNDMSQIKFVKLIRISRLLRLTRLLKFSRYFLKSDFLRVFEFNNGVAKLVSLFFIFLLMMHLIACVWCYLAIIEEDDADNWVTYFGFENLMPISKYIASLYFTVSVVTTIGYGDIYPKTSRKNIIMNLNFRSFNDIRYDMYGLRCWVLFLCYWLPQFNYSIDGS